MTSGGSRRAVSTGRFDKSRLRRPWPFCAACAWACPRVDAAKSRRTSRRRSMTERRHRSAQPRERRWRAGCIRGRARMPTATDPWAPARGNWVARRCKRTDSASGRLLAALWSRFSLRGAHAARPARLPAPRCGIVQDATPRGFACNLDTCRRHPHECSRQPTDPVQRITASVGRDYLDDEISIATARLSPDVRLAWPRRQRLLCATAFD